MVTTVSPLPLPIETRVQLFDLLQLGTRFTFSLVYQDGVPTLRTNSTLATVPTDDVVAALELLAFRTGHEHVQCLAAGSSISRLPSTPLFA